MYTQVNQYHVVLEAEAGVPEGPEQARQALHPGQRLRGRDGHRARRRRSRRPGRRPPARNALTSSALYTPAANDARRRRPSVSRRRRPRRRVEQRGDSAGDARARRHEQRGAAQRLRPLRAGRPSRSSSRTRGSFPSVTVSFNLAPGASLGAARSPPSTAVQTGPAHARRASRPASRARRRPSRNSLSSEPLLILAALVTVYIVLGVLYESFIHPVTILSTLPSAGVGALLALIVFHQDLSVVAIIGIVLLIGIVKKNGIMMVDFALEAERKGGKTAASAIYEACLLRFRPILMTTMAALLGGLPLALGTGFGSELRRPLGIAMVGGLLLSQVLTLYTTPVIYIFFDNLARRFATRERAATAAGGRRPRWPGPT